MIMADIERLDAGNPDGMYIGYKATQKIGAYGTAPVAQPSGITTSVASTATTTSIQTSLNSLIAALSTQYSGIGWIA
jgi:type IV secretory pathway TrbL component